MIRELRVKGEARWLHRRPPQDRAPHCSGLPLNVASANRLARAPRQMLFQGSLWNVFGISDRKSVV